MNPAEPVPLAVAIRELGLTCNVRTLKRRLMRVEARTKRKILVRTGTNAQAAYAVALASVRKHLMPDAAASELEQEHRRHTAEIARQVSATVLAYRESVDEAVAQVQQVARAIGEMRISFERRIAALEARAAFASSPSRAKPGT